MEKQYKDENVTVTFEDGDMNSLSEGSEFNLSASYDPEIECYTIEYGCLELELNKSELRALVTFAKEMGIEPYDLTESK